MKKTSRYPPVGYLQRNAADPGDAPFHSHPLRRLPGKLHTFQKVPCSFGSPRRPVQGYLHPLPGSPRQ